MDGVIVINKPWGKTSHDMVYFIRKTTGIKKVGHTGTLDPAATGVLPICIGKATKAADMLTASDKAYRAELVLGMTTDTLDAEGEVLTEQPCAYVTKQMLEDTIKKFIGEVYQIPPMFSAIKKDGKKLYELAREGKTVEREKRRVFIHNIELLSFDSERGTAEIAVDCSKGTYIRTLCEDIGMSLGCGAYTNRLVRTKSGRFSLEESYTVEQITDMAVTGDLEKHIIPVSELFCEYDKVTVSERQAQLVKNGVRIRKSGLSDGNLYRVFSQSGQFLALSEYKDGVLILKKAFWS